MKNTIEPNHQPYMIKPICTVQAADGKSTIKVFEPYRPARKELQLFTYPDEDPSRPFFYMAAIPAQDNPVLDLPLVSRTVEAVKAAAFSYNGTQAKRLLTRDYTYYTWLPMSGWEPGSAMVIEIIPWEAIEPGVTSDPGRFKVLIPIK